MSTVKYKVYDLTTAQVEFDTIMDILSDNETLLSDLVSELDSYKSDVVDKLKTQIEEFRDMHEKMDLDMAAAKTEISNIQSNASIKFKPVDENKLLSFKTPEVLSALKGIGSVLAENLNTTTLSPSEDFLTWINTTDNELCDGLLEAVLNPIDERRQKKAEEVYRANQTVYEAAYENFLDDMTFQTEIDYIERVITEVDGFSKEDFPTIAEGNSHTHTHVKA